MPSSKPTSIFYQPQGDEIDVNAGANYFCKKNQSQNSDINLYQSFKGIHRDLACVLLADLSLSTDSKAATESKIPKWLSRRQKSGLKPFCVTIDENVEDYLSYIYGSNDYLVIRKPEQLTTLTAQAN